MGRWPAIWVLVAWFVMQLVMGVFSAASSAPGGVAFGAHIGGFVAGCLLVTLFKRRGVPLWRRY
jgi:membrane associated rhomboid family serine protease